jgi:flagella basal body P-ring formation protein FlgA
MNARTNVSSLLPLALAIAVLSGALLNETSNPYHVIVGALDSRLRLLACERKLEGFAAAESLAPRMTIGVRCLQPNWTVYVPVSIESDTQVLVLRRALPRNSVVTHDDVESQTRRVPGFVANYITETQLTGRHLRAASAPGTALTFELLQVDTLIKRGQRVTLIASAGGLEVHAQGEAMADATVAGRIRVLNLGSRRIVEGTVETPDRVRISL